MEGKKDFEEQGFSKRSGLKPPRENQSDEKTFIHLNPSKWSAIVSVCPHEKFVVKENYPFLCTKLNT